MRKYLILIYLSISCLNFVCKSNEIQDEFLDGLSKSYVLNKPANADSNEFFLEYKVNYSVFEKDSLEYYTSLQKLMNSNITVVETLLRFEENSQMCTWIKTVAPYSSTIHPDDLINKSTAAKILIDNYLLGNENIKIAPYIKKLKYSWLKSWYKKEKSKNILITQYKEHIKTLLD